MKFSTKKLICALLIFVMVLSFASCKADEEGFYIEGNSSITIQVNETYLLEAVKPDNAKGKVQWESSNEAVAVVADGAVVGVASGVAVITATLGDYSDKVIVTVSTPKGDNNTGNNGGTTGGNTTGGNTTGGNTTGGNTTGGNTTGGNTTGGNTTGGNTTGGNTTGGNTTGGNTSGGNTTGGNTGTTQGLLGSIDFTSTTHRVSLSTSEQVWTNGNVTLRNTEGANPVADYTPIRFYPNSGVIIECQGMKKIVMTCDNQYKDSTGALQAAATAAGASVVVDGETITITLPSTMNSFTMTVTTQARVKTLEVYSN